MRNNSGNLLDGKITITILLHIPKHSALNYTAWTSDWVNQKGYVTCFYNVTHVVFVKYPLKLGNVKIQRGRCRLRGQTREYL